MAYGNLFSWHGHVLLDIQVLLASFRAGLRSRPPRPSPRAPPRERLQNLGQKLIYFFEI